MKKNHKENSKNKLPGAFPSMKKHGPNPDQAPAGSISRTGFLKSVGNGIAAAAMAAIGLGNKTKDKKKI